MSKKFLTSIDLGASATIISLAPSTGTGDPSGGKPGQLYYNTTANELRYYNVSTASYQSISAGGSGVSQSYVDSASLNAYNLGVTYTNSASLNAYTTASAWVAARGYLTSESDTLQTVTGRGATASTAISITNSTAATDTTTGALKVTGGVGIGGNLYVGGNLEVTGSGYFGGSAVNISASNLNISDSLVYLATGNSGNIVDIGIVGHYNDGLYQHTGLVRDASDSKYKLFYNVTTEPSTTIDFTSASYSTLQVGGIEIVQPGGTVSAARVYSATIGNGSATTASVTHNLNTRDVTVNVYDASTYDTVEVDVTRASVNVVVITAASPLTNNGYRVVVTG